jgi:hypothetical protein
LIGLDRAAREILIGEVRSDNGTRGDPLTRA